MSELEATPSYVKGRLDLVGVNSGVDELNALLKTKQGILAQASKRGAKLKSGDEPHVQRWRAQADALMAAMPASKQKPKGPRALFFRCSATLLLHAHLCTDVG